MRLEAKLACNTGLVMASNAAERDHRAHQPDRARPMSFSTRLLTQRMPIVREIQALHVDALKSVGALESSVLLAITREMETKVQRESQGVHEAYRGGAGRTARDDRRDEPGAGPGAAHRRSRPRSPMMKVLEEKAETANGAHDANDSAIAYYLLANGSWRS